MSAPLYVRALDSLVARRHVSGLAALSIKWFPQILHFRVTLP
ncbi:hypothetical protein [Thioclava marina]|jgi:hypothetical protein|nr:hypothetical protein [Thioclava marina]